MKDTEYSIKDFIKDALAILSDAEDEQTLLNRIQPLAIRAAAHPDLIQPSMYEADEVLGFGSTLLHEEADLSLFVVVDSWLPGRGVRPHDHGTWAVVVGLDGTEHNAFWRRLDEGEREGYAQLEKTGEAAISEGESIMMKSGEIHSVENRSHQATLSFHVYGRHLNHTGRSQFDIENGREIPFIIETR